MRTLVPVIAVTSAVGLAGGEPQTVMTVAQRDGWRADLDAPSAEVSADGRYVAFTSYLGLVPADVNLRRDVYVLDCADGRVTLESLTPAGRLSDDDSSRPGISADGWTIVYETTISADRVSAPGVVLRDRRRGVSRVIAAGSRESRTGGAGLPPSAATATSSCLPRRRRISCRMRPESARATCTASIAAPAVSVASAWAPTSRRARPSSAPTSPPA